jgi:nicotinamidase/pyrazinamidase
MRPGDVVDLNGLEQVLWPAHCIQNTPGAEFAASLDTSRVARVFDKGTDPGVDSYSGFFDNSRRHETGLHEYLKSRSVTEVYVAGLATDVCVQATALDALELGHRTHVIADACRSVNLHAGDGDAALAAMRRAGVRVVGSESLGG